MILTVGIFCIFLGCGLAQNAIPTGNYDLRFVKAICFRDSEQLHKCHLGADTPRLSRVIHWLTTILGLVLISIGIGLVLTVVDLDLIRS